MGKDWSESSYLRVVHLYRQAEQLDPYETLYPLRLAIFQLECDRSKDAVRTTRQALERRPNSLDLLNWYYLTATRLNLDAEARLALERGLLTAPMDNRWWLRRYRLARRQGEGPQARAALAVALTANLEDPSLIQAARRAAGLK